MRTRRFGSALLRIRTATICAIWIGILCTPPLRAQSLPPYSGPGSPPPTTTSPRSAQLPLYATRQNVFGIPFTVDRRVAQPVEVHLYVSVDQGNTWQLYSRQTPTARQFTFRASGDGEYWFTSRTLDGAQQSQTQGPLQPELRVVVDTVPPQIEFTARPGDKGEVVTSWQVYDQNLLASSLKVEYQEGLGEPWKPIAVKRPDEDVVQTSYQGQMTWWPETTSPTINIRAELRDRAGNLGVVNRRLLLPSLVAQQSSAAGNRPARPVDPFARMGQQSEGAVAWPSDNQSNAFQSSNSQAASGQGVGHQSPWGSVAANRRPVASGTNAPSDMSAGMGPESARSLPPPSAAFPVSRNATPAQPTSLNGSSLSNATSVAPDLEGGDFPLEGTPPVDDAMAFPPPAAELSNESPSMPGGETALNQADLPPGERPQMTNSSRFRLEYDVDSVGPAGAAEVQLWATADGGHTWRLWGTDEDRRSPFDVAAEQEGIFGFHVVVVGHNGMSGRKPRSGDPADVWVGVDTTPPTARLTSAVYGEGPDIGKLLIHWQAADPYLDSHPITLSFSESAAGPWTTIASSLPNTGRFAWPADPQLPPSVFLRLEVRDQAGNVASDQTSEPVLVEGLAPKARIRGILPVREIDREAYRHPRRG